MASADQMKALLQSHADGDDDRFYAVALQVAASEAQRGHTNFANELRDLVDDAKSRRSIASVMSVGAATSSLSNVVDLSYPRARKGDLVISDKLIDQIQRVINEHRRAGRILEQGLSLKRKLLFIGPEGTGKTFAASVLAGELGIPMFHARFDVLYSRFRDETPFKLHDIFQTTGSARGVYFFSHVDIPALLQDSLDDVSEKQYVLTSLLRLLEQDHSHSIIVVSTSYPDTLDIGLVGCFDDVLEYDFPNVNQIAKLLETRLRHVSKDSVDWRRLAGDSVGLSHSEVLDAANDAMKSLLMSESDEISEFDIQSALSQRKHLSDKITDHRKS